MPPLIAHRHAAHESNGRAHRARQLLLTGVRIIVLDGQATTLTGETFRALIELVLAHGEPAAVPRNSIRRLRQALDAAFGPGVGVELIETAGQEHYRLTINPKHYKKQVLLTRCFLQLVGQKIVSEIEMKRLRRLCHILGKKRAEKLFEDAKTATGLIQE